MATTTTTKKRKKKKTKRKKKKRKYREGPKRTGTGDMKLPTPCHFDISFHDVKEKLKGEQNYFKSKA